jgi:hypothetical protein
MRQPSVTKHFQAGSGRAVQVCFKGQSLSLFVPSAQYPLNWHGAGHKSDGDTRILKPVRGKAELRLQSRGSNPARLSDVAAMRTCEFNAAQGLAASATVVRGEAEIPKRYRSNCARYVNQEKTPHNILRCEWYVFGYRSSNDFTEYFSLVA